ncbi:MAG TPA: hypothetical protein VNS32_06215 [Flavisolibacter sp.]|nr:hypothetical protein [Flavisolibacter sp.]
MENNTKNEEKARTSNPLDEQVIERGRQAIEINKQVAKGSGQTVSDEEEKEDAEKWRNEG